MADDPIAAALTEKRIALVGGTPDQCYKAGQALLGALNAAVKHHQPVQLYGTAEDYAGNIICGHDADYDGDLHFEGDDGLWRCKSCPEGVVCSSCADGSATDLLAEWQCPTYADILAALTGERADSGQAAS